MRKNTNRDPNIITVKTRGKKRTVKQKENHSKILAQYYETNPRGPMEQHHKDAISKGTKGKKKPASQGAAISATVAKQRAEGTHYSQIKLQCPHCPVKSAKHRYNAFHGDKCKHNPNKDKK